MFFLRKDTEPSRKEPESNEFSFFSLEELGSRVVVAVLQYPMGPLGRAQKTALHTEVGGLSLALCTCVQASVFLDCAMKKKKGSPEHTFKKMGTVWYFTILSLSNLLKQR